MYLRDTDELFFAGLDLSKDVVNKISMKAVENALEETSGTVVNVPATPVRAIGFNTNLLWMLTIKYD